MWQICILAKISNRLGKRDYNILRNNLVDQTARIAMQNGLGPDDLELLMTLMRSMRDSNTDDTYNNGQLGSASLVADSRVYPMDLFESRRGAAKHMDDVQLIDSILANSGSPRVKRVPFTPRIG